MNLSLTAKKGYKGNYARNTSAPPATFIRIDGAGQPLPGIESGLHAGPALSPSRLHSSHSTMHHVNTTHTTPLHIPKQTRTAGIVLITRGGALPTRMTLHADGAKHGKDQHGKLGTHGDGLLLCGGGAGGGKGRAWEVSLQMCCCFACL